MSYVQCSDGYKLKCDKCGAELHKEHETKPYIAPDLIELTKLGLEYGWSFYARTIICTYCKTFKRYKL